MTRANELRNHSSRRGNGAGWADGSGNSQLQRAGDLILETERRTSLASRAAVHGSLRVAALIGAVLISGCGGVESGPVAGKMTVTYRDATSAEAIRGRALMKDARLLEDVAQDANDSLKLPEDVALVADQCGRANAAWNSARREIKMCYELADLNLQLFEEDPEHEQAHPGHRDAVPAQAAVNATIAVFFHELGHAVISIYDLPITGREEDVADQLAAYAILEPDDLLKQFPNAAGVTGDYALMFKKWAADRDWVAPADFAAVHSLSETRMFNLKCWIYGSDPAGHADMVADGSLPESRSAGCPEEFHQLSRAWFKLLAPHLKWIP